MFMYELQDLNQNVVQNFYETMANTLEKKNILPIVKAIEFAVKKELPNEPQHIIVPIIRTVIKELKKTQLIKIEPFKYKDEGYDLFKKQYGDNLRFAEQKDCPEIYKDMIDVSYDLAKYDKKIIYKNQEYLFNTNFLLQKFKQHMKADARWLRYNKLKKQNPERNTNISLNTNTILKKQLSFLNPKYNLYNSNPYHKDLTTDMELNLIDAFKEDKHMIARAIGTINNIKFRIDKIKENKISSSLVKSFDTMQHTLDSDVPIQRKDIINSWLTNIAYLYIKINPQHIPKTLLSEYITKVARATTIYKLSKKDNCVFSPDQLREATFREIKYYKGLRLLEITDNRKKLTKSEQTIIETERYLKNITQYLHKYGL